MTQPPTEFPSMDLVDWAIPNPISHLVSVYLDDLGQVWVTLDSGEVINLNVVDHLVIRILDVPLAIQTKNVGFSTVEVLPETMFEILIPGIPVNYGFPEYGSQFNVVVGCNQP